MEPAGTYFPTSLDLLWTLLSRTMPFFLFENIKKAAEDKARTNSHNHVYHQIRRL
jgi:hypothetical protein